VGLLAGALSALLTISVYAVEDAFQRLKIHWMWWPAMGGLAIGLGGLVFPQALGVGYDTIGALLQGTVTTHLILGVLLVKWFIWAVSLGSGTSGGVLAPLLMMGGALGGLETMFLPNEGSGFWPLISMGAILGGTMRSPFTSIVFAFELTHDANVFLRADTSDCDRGLSRRAAPRGGIPHGRKGIHENPSGGAHHEKTSRAGVAQ
jgi:CIC family chloride channel protein